MFSDHGHYFYLFGLARLCDSHLAQYDVQETFLAAIKSPSFVDQFSSTTGLAGVLKYTIMIVCKKNRETVVSNLINDYEHYSADNYLRLANG